MKLIQTVKRRMGNENEAGKRGGVAAAKDPASAKSTAGKPAKGATRRAGEEEGFQMLPLLRETPVAERAEGRVKHEE